MTDERIGRSMKKCVNMRAPTSSAASAASRRLPRSRLALRPARRDDLHRLAGHHLEHAVDDDAVALVQAVDDHDVLLAVVVADDHRPHLRRSPPAFTT